MRKQKILPLEERIVLDAAALTAALTVQTAAPPPDSAADHQSDSSHTETGATSIAATGATTAEASPGDTTNPGGSGGTNPPTESGPGGTPPPIAGGGSNGYDAFNIPILNSLPGAVFNLYLDFNGYVGQALGGGNVTIPTFDFNAGTGPMTVLESQIIQTVWQIVSEDFSPFNINVTTVQPTDMLNSLSIVIGGNGSWTGGGAGISIIDGFKNANTNYHIGFVFSDNLGLTATNRPWAQILNTFATVISHEAGHILGLRHYTSDLSSTPNQSQAIMVEIQNPNTQIANWNSGTLLGGGTQDDLAVITKTENRGIAFRADSYGDTISSATHLTATNNEVGAYGIIGSTTDKDVFSFRTGSGEVTFALDTALITAPSKSPLNPEVRSIYGADLDATLTIYDSIGNVVASINPSNTQDALLTVNLAAGDYFLEVSSRGQYGDIGQYFLRGTVQPEANQAPIDIALNNNSINENSANGSVIGSLTATDPGDTSASYTLLDDAGGRFAISGNQLVVANGGLLDFESNANHSVTVRVTDSGGLTFDKTFTINVSNVNEVPTNIDLSGQNISENSGNGALIGSLSSSDPDSGDTATYQLIDNAGGRFAISGSQLVVANGALLNFEANASHSVTVRVTDSGGLTFDKTFTIAVNDINEAPAIGDQTLSITENSPAGTVVGTVTASDPDGGDHVTYAFAPDDPAIAGQIDAAMANYISARDNYLIAMGNLNGTLVSTLAFSAAQGSYFGALLQVRQLVSQQPNVFFNIDANSGVVTLKPGVTLDYEFSPSFTPRVIVTDSQGVSSEATLTINVNNVNEAPEILVLTNSSVDHNASAGTIVGGVGVFDPDGQTIVNSGITYTLIDSAGGKFVLNPEQTNQLITTNLFNGNQGSYSITIRASDGQFSYDQTFTITVLGANQAPTDIALSGNHINENSANGTLVGNLSAVDPNAGDAASYQLLDNAGGRFAISGSQLVVANGALLNFEANASHSVTVRVTDSGGLTFDKTFTIAVNDINEAPAIGGQTLSITENSPAGTLVGTVTASDPDGGDHVTYAFAPDDPAIAGQIDAAMANYISARDNYLIAMGNLNGTLVSTLAFSAAQGSYFGALLQVRQLVSQQPNVFFNIDANSGVVTLKPGVTLDYEFSPSFTPRVIVTDSQGVSSEATLTINVSNVNEAPEILVLTNSSVDHNASAGTIVGGVGVFDPDGQTIVNSGITYTLIDSAGGKFVLNPEQTNQLITTNLFNGNQGSYSITIRASDGQFSYDQTFTITVLGANQAPTDIALSGNHINENSANGTLVGNLSAVDPNAGDTASYQLLDNAGGRFAISGSQLVVADGALLNFEANASHSVTVRVTDSGGLSFDKTFTIAVNDINEAPTNIALTNQSVNENAVNGTIVGSLATTDPDAADSASYQLLDNAGGRFALSNGQLIVANGALLNFEANSSHSVTIRVTDSGGLSYDKSFIISINNVNEAPADIALSGQSVNENAANGTVVGSLSTSDPDAADSASYQLLDNAGGRFALSNGQLIVANGALLNFEANSSHSVTIRVTDSGGLSYDKVFTIAVNNVNEAPTDIALSGQNVNENAANGTVVGSLSRSDPDGDSASYQLLDNAGGRFALSNGQLVVANGALLNFEANSSHSVTIRVTDSGGLSYDKVFTIIVNNVNEAPTNINLSGQNVNENAANGTVVGNLSTIDPDVGDSASYQLLNNAGGRFAISGNQLIVANGALLDFETNASHTVTIRSLDAGGLFYDKTFTINLNDLPDTPTSQNPNLVFISPNLALYVENKGPTLIAPLAVVTDPDSPNFDGGKLTIAITQNGRFDDVLSIAQKNQITLNGSDVYYRGTKIGSWMGGTNSQSLVITFNQNANAKAVSALAGVISFSNSGDDPGINVRNVRYTISDGDGGISTPVDRNVITVGINDDPNIAIANSHLNVSRGTENYIGESAGIAITDPDYHNGDLIKVTLAVQKGNLNFTDISDLNSLFFETALDADGEARITFYGTMQDVNAALNRLTYTTTARSGTDTLSITVYDMNNNLLDLLAGSDGQDKDKIILRIG